jgi:C4-type Zn-finger protein
MTDEILKCPVCNKRCYSSRHADEVIGYAKNHNRNNKIPKRKYYCKDCGFYHLTSQAFSKISPYQQNRRKKRYIKYC